MKRSLLLLPLAVVVSCAEQRSEPAGYPAVVAPRGTESAPREEQAPPPPVAPPPPADGERLKSLGYVDDASRRPTEGQRGSATDFGGRMFLSNDDSMSLASAQRVLWAVAEGQPVAASELRPHELLNYFTFTPAPVARRDTFGVSASAVSTGDGLSLALTVTADEGTRRPLDLTLLIDRSGSMENEGRMEYLKRGLVRMVDRLHAGDRVSVVLFDDRVDVAWRGFVVGGDDLDDLRVLFEELQPRGATNLDAGLEAAYGVAREMQVPGRDARVLVITDAQITSGDVNPARVTEIGRAFDESGVRLAAIGVGRQFDDHVLQQLTEKGRGAYVYLGSEKVVDRVFGSGFDSLVRVAADDVSFALDLPDSLGMARFYGEEMSTVAADVTPVSFHAGTTQVFLQDLAVAPSGIVRSAPLTLDIRWDDPLTGKQRTQRWETTVGAAMAADSANVDKARALMAWTDLVRAGKYDCHREKREWQSRARSFGGDQETRYLDGLVAGWCRGDEGGGAIAEAQ